MMIFKFFFKVNDIWSSNNYGVSWTLITPSSSIFTARRSFGSLIISDYLIVMGGYSGTSPTYKNDVWITNISQGYTLSNDVYICSAGYYGSATIINGSPSGCTPCPGIFFFYELKINYIKNLFYEYIYIYII